MSLTDDWTGRRLGKYRLGPLLGRGGMGCVYEGTDLHLCRPVAVKLLPADRDGFPRLLREARTAARVSHPNVVSTYDVGREGAVFYIVMELVRGPTAQALVAARGALPWAEATTVVAAACRGLFAAHAAGLVHRDVKPANVLCPVGAEPKLADFGLAKPALGGANLTHAHTLLGTPEYMSPEQCRGEPLDPRTDVYSLGATYYFLLAGRLPFLARDRTAVMFAHCSAAAPDPRDVNPGVPEACAAVVARAMAKKRADRYPDCRAMTAALRAVLGGTGVELPALTEAVVVEPLLVMDLPTEVVRAHPTRRRWVRAAAGVVGAAALLGAIGTVLVRRERGENPSDADRGTGQPGRAEPTRLLDADRLARAWSLPPEAGRVLWPAPPPFGFATSGTAPGLTLWDAARVPRPLPTATRVTAAAGEPGGRWFAAATADGWVSLWAGEGLTPAGRVRLGAAAVALAGHGSVLAAATPAGVQLFDVSAPTSPVARALDRPFAPGAAALAFGPDGTYLAGVGGNVIEVWDVPGHRLKARSVQNAAVTLTAATFGAAAGQLCVLGRTGGRGVFVLWDPVGAGPPREASGPGAATAVARAGPLVAVAGGGWLGLYSAFAPTPGARPLTSHLRSNGIRSLVVAPGRQYACGYEDGAVEVWVHRPDAP